MSLESFEALEARLAQEMSNIGEHMYGDEDDENDESSVVSVSSIKKRKVDTLAEFELKEFVANSVKKVKFNGSFEHTDNVPRNNSLNSSDKENHIIENSVSQTPKRRISEEFTGFSAAERKRSEKIMEKVVKADSQSAIPTQDSSTKLVTSPKTNDNRLFIKLDKIDLKTSAEVESKQNGDISAIEEEPCYFFRKESLLVSERRLAILNQYVVRLEQHVNGTQKNVPHIIKVSKPTVVPVL